MTLRHVLRDFDRSRPLRALHLFVLLSMLAATHAGAGTITYGQDDSGIPGFSGIQRGNGLSLHKANYILPATFAKNARGDETEVIFQFSIKQRLLVDNLYGAYTQKTFWNAYNLETSAPVRETLYNWEFFYRGLPGDNLFSRWHLDRWGFDAGVDHFSNGQVWPQSRSMTQLYVAPFRPAADGNSLWYLKAWYRVREHKKAGPLDQGGDDNPDILRYYGWTEASYRHLWSNQVVFDATVRGNLATGRGALSLQFSKPSSREDFFYVLNVFTGYGESLIDYNREITRIGIGLMFNR